MIERPKHIIISRTDKIGDVILTLPMAGILKKEFPEVKVSFLGNTYTKSIIENSSYVDEFLNWDEIKQDAVNNLKALKADFIIHVYPDKFIAAASKSAGINMRVGTSHRIFHWWTCNKLVNLGRKNSNLHEAQLNIKLLDPLKIRTSYPLNELHEFYGWEKAFLYKEEEILNPKKFNLILHTKSRGSAREWPMKNFYSLVQKLQDKNINVIISGTKEEGEIIYKECPELLKLPNVINITGTLSLSSFIELIKKADGLIACSTGPLHIAAASGIFALGLYPPIKPMHPGRWAPVGKKATYLVKDIHCSLCRKGGTCICLNEISPETVKEQVFTWYDLSLSKING